MSSYPGEPSHSRGSSSGSSKSSYYSGSNLPAEDPNRHYTAAEVRRQTQEAPRERTRYKTDDGKRQKTSYPKTFSNSQDLPGLNSSEPRYEFPLATNQQGNFRQYPKSQSTKPGAFRTIYSQDKTDDRSNFDVLYHDPTKGGGNNDDFSKAAYREAQHRAQPSLTRKQRLRSK